MLPTMESEDDYLALRRDHDTQRRIVTTVAERCGMATAELEPFGTGTQLVWHAGDAVLKVFVPLWPEDAEVETTVLRHLSGSGWCIPDLMHEGELDGWPYVVMTRVEGERIGDVWPTASQEERIALARDMGETMARLADTSTVGLEHLVSKQDDLLPARRAKVREDQRARGGDDVLDAALERFLEQLTPLVPAEPVLLHADLTNDHFLIQDGRVTGLIDFADAFVGPWTYELAAPECFVTGGDFAAERAMLEGRGVKPTPELLDSLRAWCVLHRYAHVAYMLRVAKEESLESWLGTLWQEGDV